MNNRIFTIFLAVAVCLVLFGKVVAANFTETRLHYIGQQADIVQKPDTAKINGTTLPNDSTAKDTTSVTKVSTTQRKQQFEHPIDFSSVDSIVLYGNGDAFLHKEGKIIYKDGSNKEITADFISVKMDSSTFHAQELTDSLGKPIGKPVLFKEGGRIIEAKEMNFNFKTQKGYIRGAKTQEGEGR